MTATRFEQLSQRCQAQYRDSGIDVTNILNKNKGHFDQAQAPIPPETFNAQLSALNQSLTFGQVQTALNNLGLIAVSKIEIEAIKSTNQARFLAQATTWAPNIENNREFLQNGLQGRFQEQLQFIAVEMQRLTHSELDRQLIDKYDQFIFHLEHQLRQLSNAVATEHSLKTTINDFLTDKLFNEIKANIKLINERQQLEDRLYYTTAASKMSAKSTNDLSQAQQWLSSYIQNGEMDQENSEHVATANNRITINGMQDKGATKDGTYTVVPVPFTPYVDGQNPSIRAAVLIEHTRLKVSATFTFQMPISREAHYPEWPSWVPQVIADQVNRWKGGEELTLPGAVDKLEQGRLYDWAHASIESIYACTNNRYLPIKLNLETMPHQLAKTLVLYCEAMNIRYTVNGIPDWKPSAKEIDAVRKMIQDRHILTDKQKEEKNESIVMPGSASQQPPKNENDEKDDPIKFSIGNR